MVRRHLLDVKQVFSKRRIAPRAAQPATRHVTIQVEEETKGFSLPAGHFSVGGSPDCDIVVPGCLEDVVCALDLLDRPPYAILTATTPDCTLSGEPLVRGKGYVLTNASQFSGRGLSIRVDVPTSDAPLDAPWPRLRYAMSVAAGLAGILVLSYALSGGDRSSDVGLRPVSPAPTVAQTPESVLAALQRRLLELGVSSPPKMAAEIDKIVIDLPADAKRRELVTALVADMRQRTTVPIVTRAAVDERMLNLIAGASFFPRKLVIGRNGQAYAEGDTIGGEWRVRDIRPDGVVLDRGQEQITVALGDKR